MSLLVMRKIKILMYFKYEIFLFLLLLQKIHLSLVDTDIVLRLCWKVLIIVSSERPLHNDEYVGLLRLYTVISSHFRMVDGMDDIAVEA
jgi:hypothetical protein